MKISNSIGIPICINISLLFLTILNFSFSYTTGIYSAIIIRMLTGLFNNLSALSRVILIINSGLYIGDLSCKRTSSCNSFKPGADKFKHDTR